MNAKSTGIVRHVDDLGRVVIPIELRRTLRIGVKDPMEILVDGNNIILRRYNTVCMFCHDVKNVRSFRQKAVCASCLAEIREQFS